MKKFRFWLSHSIKNYKLMVFNDNFSPKIREKLEFLPSNPIKQKKFCLWKISGKWENYTNIAKVTPNLVEKKEKSQKSGDVTSKIQLRIKFSTSRNTRRMQISGIVCQFSSKSYTFLTINTLTTEIYKKI